MQDHAPVKPPKQEQERASEEVTELAPGVLRSQLPIDMPGLGHVNCYILEDERGVAIVDPGMPEQASYDAIEARLKSIGVPLSRVHTVIITHSHPDHFGGARWVREHSGADVVTHRWFHVGWDAADAIPDLDAEELAALADRPWGATRPWDAPPWGGDPLEFGAGGPDVPSRERVREFLRFAQPSIRLRDTEPIRLAGRDWFAVHTPGHTDDHLCLFDPTEGLMLSGDHVLPTITPHISGVAHDADPLARFFDSLDKVAAFGPQVNLALPAHGHPFPDLAGRANDDQGTPRRPVAAPARRIHGARPAGDGAGDVDAPVLGASPGAHGRQRDVRPPRAPACHRRDGTPGRRRRRLLHLRADRLSRPHLGADHRRSPAVDQPQIDAAGHPGIRVRGDIGGDDSNLDVALDRSAMLHRRPHAVRAGRAARSTPPPPPTRRRRC